ncbi:hypothetical protein INT46_001059 [Mucor plumbeus]|uniref:Uncharacterized protein n=1 Tax=Mucor plumbeus TaxID=97098 RepID=A0A8H7RDB4_9FUNG|nr:hypothetical protein INT46_001059 [Mucor plumbeus]
MVAHRIKDQSTQTPPLSSLDRQNFIQVEDIIELVTRKLPEEQTQEAENRTRGNPLPSAIVEELDHYSKTDSLPKAIQKYKKEIPKYNCEDWITVEISIPNFIGELKQHKVDSLQFTNLIYKFIETTRVQAREATQIYERLNFFSTRGFQPGDESVMSRYIIGLTSKIVKPSFFDISESTIANEAQSLPKLAVFGFGAARLRYPEARDATLKAIKLPSTLKNLKPQHSIGDKKYAFSKEFLRQYYDETFKQRITCQPTNNREGYAQQLRIPRK